LAPERPPGLVILARSARADAYGLWRVAVDVVVDFARRHRLPAAVIEFDAPTAAAALAIAARDPRVDLFWALGTTAASLPRVDGVFAKPWVSVIGNPPFYPNALQVLRLPEAPRYVAVVDADARDLAVRLGGEGVVPVPHRPQAHRALLEATPSPLAGRAIPILWCATHTPPEQFRATWRAAPPPTARLAEAIAEAADGDFRRPLAVIADTVARAIGSPIDLLSPAGLTVLQAVNRFLTMRAKERIVARLATRPCQLIVSALPDGIRLHPKAEVSGPVPYVELLRRMSAARAVVTFMPNRMTGAIGERVPNALAAGAIPLVADSPAIRHLTAAGAPVFAYGPDLVGLDAHLDALEAAPPAFQEAAAAGRRAAAAFDSDHAVAGILGAVLGPRWSDWTAQLARTGARPGSGV